MAGAVTPPRQATVHVVRQGRFKRVAMNTASQFVAITHNTFV